MKSEISVVIPTYNEGENVISLILEIKKATKKLGGVEIIIVDDDSPDKTGVRARKRFAKDKSVKVFVRKREKGLASAILYGIKRAKGETIIGMDADFNHSPKKIPEFIKALKDCDLVVGSRFIRGGGMEDKRRYYLTYAFNLFLKYGLSFPTMDNMSGYYAAKRRKLSLLRLEKIYRGYGEYHLRLVYSAKKEGLEIKEIPVFYKKRKFGKSKSNLSRLVFVYTKVAFNLRFASQNEI